MKRVLILGGGSAGMSAARRAIDLGAEAVVFNAGLPVGGTCLNVGCVPSKYLIRAAESARRAAHSRHPGVSPRGVDLDTRALLAATRDLVRDLRGTNYDAAIRDWPGLTFIPHPARVTSSRSVEAAGNVHTGDGIVVCTGSRPGLPAVPGLPETPHLTNETLFAPERLPESVIVLGGGYIALECAQFLHRLGVRTTLLQRGERLLSRQPAYVGEALLACLRDEGMDLRPGARLRDVAGHADGVRVETGRGTVAAAALLVATGRRGNARGIGLEELGVEIDDRGFVKTGPHLETAVPGVYAAGDALGGRMFVYTASAEAELAVENLLDGTRTVMRHDPLPWVVFTDPQVAGTGLDEEQARAAGHEVDTAELPVARWPRFRVAGETRGFLRLVRDRAANVLLGARAVAPEAGDLMTEISLLVRHRTAVPEILRAPCPYLTLSEGIQRCAMRFGG